MRYKGVDLNNVSLTNITTQKFQYAVARGGKPQFTLWGKHTSSRWKPYSHVNQNYIYRPLSVCLFTYLFIYVCIV